MAGFVVASRGTPLLPEHRLNIPACRVNTARLCALITAENTLLCGENTGRALVGATRGRGGAGMGRQARPLEQPPSSIPSPPFLPASYPGAREVRLIVPAVSYVYVYLLAGDASSRGSRCCHQIRGKRHKIWRRVLAGVCSRSADRAK
ncbi:hypothetical protein E2C01_072391 [Portunus trituberculatus]|uniref:Uncharacterized protein n=1 Tax=Portunus trituberculatus TaxID=210409 RepID=A0A5B7HXU7_PORTR|nr:hypothetical protein [Portunus trituberculatus]